MQGPIPSNRPRLWGSGSASLKKAAICERQLNEAGRYRGNFMSIFDDLPPAHLNPVLTRFFLERLRSLLFSNVSRKAFGLAPLHRLQL